MVVEVVTSKVIFLLETNTVLARRYKTILEHFPDNNRTQTMSTYGPTMLTTIFIYIIYLISIIVLTQTKRCNKQKVM